MAELTNKQVEFAAQCMAQYLRVLEDEGRGLARAVDVDHSALLRRILSGKKPLPQPPPKRYSYPCYSLGEGLETEIQDLRERDYGDGERVIVDQCSDWVWEDKDKGFLKHLPTGHLYRFWTEKRIKEYRTAQGKEKEECEVKLLQKING